MGLMKILRKIKLKEHQVRILTLGLDNSGKTTIIKSFLSQDPTSTSPTLGFTINTLKYKSNTINFWDIGGQTTIRSYWRNYFEETDGVIWVVDSSDKLRLNDCKDELHNLLKQEKLAGATLLVFCNKQDINGALSVEEIKNVLELENITTRHWIIMPCCGLNGNGLENGLEWLMDDISSRIFMLG
jgi:ADP-ribosylation factor-like protein 2